MEESQWGERPSINQVQKAGSLEDGDEMIPRSAANRVCVH